MLHLKESSHPDFLVKSTLWCAIISALILIPFTYNHFLQTRYLLGILTSALVVISIANALLCYRGSYNKVLNVYFLAPFIVLAIVYSVYNMGMMGSYWAFIGVLALYFMLPINLAKIANIIFLGIILPVAWNTLELAGAARFSAVLIGVSFFSFVSMREIYKQHYMLREKAITDPLTGLYNRSLLHDSLEHAIHQSSRTNNPMTLILFDIDHFKKINDNFGHDVGDSVLKSMGKLLNTFFRASDMVFRYGGEEFLALLYNTDESEAVDVAEKLRGDIEQSSLISGRTVTVSIGVYTLRPGIDLEEWIKRCDKNLYRAKANGRNQVVVDTYSSTEEIIAS